MLGISKRGDTYLRTLLIHGARAAMRFAERKPDARSRWAVKVNARRGMNVASVALANKNARTAWALLNHEEVYQPHGLSVASFPPVFARVVDAMAKPANRPV